VEARVGVHRQKSVAARSTGAKPAVQWNATSVDAEPIVAVRLNDDGHFECAQCGSIVSVPPFERPTFRQGASPAGRDEFVLHVRGREIHRCGLGARRAKPA
jgi:hypothetical protein